MCECEIGKTIHYGVATDGAMIPPNNKLSLLPTRIQPNVAMMSLETQSKTSLNHAGVNLKFKL